MYPSFPSFSLQILLTEESADEKYCEEGEDSGLGLSLALEDDGFGSPIQVVMATSLF